MSQLGFQRRRPVRWLTPRVLISTGIKSMLAGIFGSYADKRELQQSLPSPVHACGDDEVWFDFVADLGDGFDATYSVAFLLAAPHLEIDGHTLPRGQMLVMGGDEVYPAATYQAYEDHTKGPYRTALPSADDPPLLFALPGNHDWYDGLTSFLRTFAQQRAIGGWRTEQARSYFAVELPHRWWLFAVDTQFGEYIDTPQLEYFRAAAERLAGGDAVILCTPTPAWAYAPDDHRGYDVIQFFDREIIRPTGARIRVMLSGDSHHYARYSGSDERITCGGGGAYTSATHLLPEELDLPPQEARIPAPVETFSLEATYPSRTESAKLAAGIFRLPFTNPGLWGLTGVLQTILAVFLQFGLTVELDGAFGELATWAPTAFMVVLVAFAAFAFARLGPPRPGRALASVLHTVAHLALAALWAAVLLWMGGAAAVWMALLVTPMLIGFLDAELVALYLLVASRWDINTNEAFAGQGIEDYKSFLRMHITRTGELEIYPVKVPRICRSWRPNPGTPRLVPDEELTAELIEDVIRVSI
ncbi:metallophosphoesterase [Kibdelosporangium persicum]|uniref:Metallophosphoesterase n=1 Tax=Kibdelosporangium persicum TaxID=2698649 RepID=A0ABX2EVP9_9PSEU|nr:metallophosphoesterase [Kibdelosporangium persicum]NRN63098.1 Metallophosphoesterase [Kibdelosporangium persicum]